MLCFWEHLHQEGLEQQVSMQESADDWADSRQSGLAPGQPACNQKLWEFDKNAAFLVGQQFDLLCHTSSSKQQQQEARKKHT